MPVKQAWFHYDCIQTDYCMQREREKADRLDLIIVRLIVLKYWSYTNTLLDHSHSHANINTYRNTRTADDAYIHVDTGIYTQTRTSTHTIAYTSIWI